MKKHHAGWVVDGFYLGQGYGMGSCVCLKGYDYRDGETFYTVSSSCTIHCSDLTPQAQFPIDVTVMK